MAGWSAVGRVTANTVQGRKVVQVVFRGERGVSEAMAQRVCRGRYKKVAMESGPRLVDPLACAHTIPIVPARRHSTISTCLLDTDNPEDYLCRTLAWIVG